MDFIAIIYELFGLFDLGNFSNDMENNGFYQPIFIVMIVSTILINVGYYYILNHPRCNRGWHWLLFNAGTSILNFIVSWGLSWSQIHNFYGQAHMMSPYGWASYFSLSSIVFAWTFILFFLFSFIIKWWSRNCKHSPFC